MTQSMNRLFSALIAGFFISFIGLQANAQPSSGGIPPDLPGIIQDGGVPASCSAPMAQADMQSQIPSLLQLGPDAAQITNIHLMADANAFEYQPKLYKIECYLQVTFSNGLQQEAKFAEWMNEYGQKMVSYDPQP